MSYNHNAEADFAASELARMFVADPRICYDDETLPGEISSTAAYESSSSGWPKADALVSILEAGNRQRDIAVEYKRQQEGIHGLLTAMGQAHAYLHKGYNGSVLVLPSIYPTHSAPASYVRDVLDEVSSSKAIGVFRFEEPDLSSPTPYAGKLHCVRPLRLITTSVQRRAATPKTQWVHMREGSTTRDGFLRFLQTAKRISSGEAPVPAIPLPLREAIHRVAPGKDPEHYLANTVDDKFLSRVWRAFWFEWVATEEVLTPWIRQQGFYATPNAFTKIEKDDGSGKSQIFEGRTSGLKETLVSRLNEGSITEETAWEQFATGMPTQPGQQKKQGVRDRAHSYREDLDSSLSQLRWIENDGRPTDYGYRYMTLCERYGGANTPAAIEYVGASLLQTGRYGSFLHYVYRLSEQRFSVDPLAFTRRTGQGSPVFNEASYSEYLSYLEQKLTDDLKVMRKVSGRDRPRTRTPFQAELTLLRNYGFIDQKRFRLGVGIPIDWEQVLRALDTDL